VERVSFMEVFDNVKQIYFLAYKRRCKGITIYRYGSKEDQVLSFGYGKDQKRIEEAPVYVDSEYSGGCVRGTCPF
jgi:ribonucleoside-diphosphate reductase alpha chain